MVIDFARYDLPNREPGKMGRNRVISG